MSMSGKNLIIKPFSFNNPLWIVQLFLYLFFNHYSSAQISASWINPNQPYLRIPISKTGFYSISKNDLLSVDFPLKNIDPRHFQLFQGGKELAIEVTGDFSLDSTSHILFWGQKNEGASDSILYTDPIPPPIHYSLYSDTSVYFLTINPEIEGKRMGIYSNEETASDTIDYHLEQIEQVFNSHYNPGNLYPPGSNFNNGVALSDYDVGEGWTGKPLSNEWQTFDISPVFLKTEALDQIAVELILVGHNTDLHEVEIWAGTSAKPALKIKTIELKGINTTAVQLKFKKEEISCMQLDNGKLAFSLFVKKGSISTSYIQWRYPQMSGRVEETDAQIFHFPSSQKTVFWHNRTTGNRWFYEIGDPYNLSKTQCVSEGLHLRSNGLMASFQKSSKPSRFKMISFTSIDSLDTDYLIITHSSLRKPANDPISAYANYRYSQEGGNYKPLILNIEEIFDQFNAGIRSPIAIKRAIHYFAQKGKLKFVLIIGKSIDPQTARKSTDGNLLDLVPNAGWPGSDWLLTTNPDNPGELSSSVPIGRINASNPEEVWIYLQKVKALEVQPSTASWRKNIMHLSGGHTFSELQEFKGYLKDFENIVTQSPLAPLVQTLTKQSQEDREQIPLQEAINRGIALITFFGHSSMDYTDIDLGYASTPSLNYHNHPYYPAVIANGCATGSIFYSPNTISQDWIFSKNNGAVLFLASTFNAVSSALKNYTSSIYEVLADTTFSYQPFGTIIHEAIRRNLRTHHLISDIATAQQMLLQGDPAIKIFPTQRPDYTFDSTGYALKSLSGHVLTTKSDSIELKMVVQNNGRHHDNDYKLNVKISDQEKIVFEKEIIRKRIYYADTIILHISNPFTQSQKYVWTATIDPLQEIAEELEDNNFSQSNIFIPAGSAVPLLPPNDFVSSLQNITLIAQTPVERDSSEVIFEWAPKPDFTNPHQIIRKAAHSLAHCLVNIPENFKTIFWRVYLTEDTPTAADIRTITFGAETDLLLPEVVALPSQPNQFLEEGDAMSRLISFQNISEQAFTDSILVKITHQYYSSTTSHPLKIPPLSSQKIVSIPLLFQTIKEPGIHRVTVHFNTDQLPETSFTNNVTHFSYEVLPDIIPPTFSVKIDHRILENEDQISAKPLIEIAIQDKNLLNSASDTSGIDIYLGSRCPDCKLDRLSLKQAILESKNLEQMNLKIFPLEALPAGIYALRIRIRDRVGNFAPDYLISFKVLENSERSYFTVFPNPSFGYFCFQAKINQTIHNTSAQIKIFNLSGNIFQNLTWPLHTGKDEIIWVPKNLPAGLYWYRIEIDANNLNRQIDGLEGKLVWIP